MRRQRNRNGPRTVRGAEAQPALPALTGLHIAVDGSGLAQPLAGVGTYTREVLGAMVAARPGHRLTVYLPAGVEPTFEAAAVAWRELPRARFAGRHLIWPRRLRKFDPDAFFGPAGQLPLGGVGAPAVITVHDLAIYSHPEWFPGGQSLSTRVLVPRSIARADAIVAVSESTARDLAGLFAVSSERVTVVPHGVGAAYRPLSAETRQEARSRLGLPERFILFVGTIEPRKNLTTLLQAWAMMSRRPRLVVAGGWGWRYEEVRVRMQRLGPDLTLLGAVQPQELPALYNLATCLAHPAWYEGFGLTPLEAMACGTPVACSDTSSLPEVVGDAGLLVAPGDVDGWRRALERLCEDVELASDLRRRGILRAAEFDWNQTATRTWTVIEHAVADR